MNAGTSFPSLLLFYFIFRGFIRGLVVKIHTVVFTPPTTTAEPRSNVHAIGLLREAEKLPTVMHGSWFVAGNR